MKKVLFISASFYPDPYVGSVRVKEFAKWLPENGWKPYVLAKNYGFKVTREEFDRNVSPDVEVRYLNQPPSLTVTRSVSSSRDKLRSLIISIFGKLFLAPDASVLFWRSVSSKILKVVDDINPDVVITTGPPQSVHTLGPKIKRASPNVMWISDFRDVYRVGSSYNPSFLELLKHRWSLSWEATTYKESDGIVCAIPEHVRWIRRLVPSANHKVRLITNGSPAEFFVHKKKQSESTKFGSGVGHSKLSVVGFSQCDEALYLAEAISRINSDGWDLNLSFVGVQPSHMNEIASLLPNSSFLGLVSHDKAIDEIMGSDILVALLSKERSRQFNLTSKLFEYCATGRPVLVVNPTRPDKRFFGAFPGVWMVHEADPGKIYLAIKEIAGQESLDYQERSSFFQRNHSRQEQSRMLAKFMSELLGF